MSSNSNVKTFSFAVVLCLIVSFGLTFAAEGLKEYQELNVKVDKQKNVLKALGLLEKGKSYSTNELLELYESGVVAAWVDESGLLNFDSGDDNKQLFLYVKEGRVESYAIPISGYGLWSTLYGYFALKGDGETVAGITFYEHKETPGLGGECEAPWFQNNFINKKIVDMENKFVSIGIFKGKVSEGIPSNKQINYVDGISGATITANGIQAFLKKDLLRYEAFSKRLRAGESIDLSFKSESLERNQYVAN